MLFSDLDVDLLPAYTPARLKRASGVGSEWAENLPAFLAERRRGSSVRALVNPDHESAINSGLLLLLPDAALYRDGLRVLHAGK